MTQAGTEDAKPGDEGDGLLTSAEIIALREKRGLSQIEFAQITRLGVATLSMWETGKRRQNAANDLYLRLLGYEANFERVRTAFKETGITESEMRTALPGVGEKLSSNAALSQVAEAVHRELKQRVIAMPGEKLETMLSALLRSMGYHPWAADPTKRQRGITLTGYSDPLGTSKGPRVFVSIVPATTPADTQAYLPALAEQLAEHDVGLLVCLGGFGEEIVKAASSSGQRIELVDADRLVDLWKRHYLHASQEDQGLLPLRTVSTVIPA